MAVFDASRVMLCPLFVLIMAGTAVADEMMFVDVNADDTFNIRGLDVPVASARGTDNFFLADPMVAHDWAYTRVVSRSLATELAAAQSTIAAQRITQLEDALTPIYAALPRNEHGLLGNGTVRYALHRLFTKRRGWSIKGLEPAGGAWLQTMSVTSDVKQVTKYIVPTLLHDMMLPNMDGRGLDLHMLAIAAATIEHLVRAETLDVLYSVYTTLELPVGGRRTEAQAETILTTFLMVFGFGSNLEISTARDMRKARAYLESHHPEWRAMQDIVRGAMHSVNNADGFEFSDIMLAVEDLERRYVQHHGRDCVRAKERFSSIPEQHNGRAPLAALKPSYEPGFRALFTEDVEQLQKLGALGSGALNPNDMAASDLIMPNYVESQALCLSTASYYTICCPNECESLLEQLELNIKASAASPEVLGQHVASLRPGSNSDSLVADLKQLAATSSDGLVALHSGDFARLLHTALPLECPAPQADTLSGVSHGTNPRTADEWMADPSGDVGDTEEMMSEIAESLAKYTALGRNGDGSDIVGEEPIWNLHESVHERKDSLASTTPAMPGRGRFFGMVLKLAAMVSLIGVALTTWKSTISAADHDSAKKKQFGAWSEHSLA